MTYPNLVYRKHGPHHCKGGTYQFMQVRDDSELETAIAEGWFLSIEDALSGVNSSAPTREEMEIKARELDLKFDGRTSDRKLMEMINAALAEE